MQKSPHRRTGTLEMNNEDNRQSPRRICNRRCLFVCLLAILCKTFVADLHEIFSEVWHWQWGNEQVIKFRWRSGSPSGYSDCFGTRHYWEIQKVVNGHKAATHTDSPDGGTGKTCLGGSGMSCLRDCSLWRFEFETDFCCFPFVIIAPLHCLIVKLREFFSLIIY